MTYSRDRDGTLDRFDDWFDSVGSNINDESSEEEIEDSNAKVQEFLDELSDEYFFLDAYELELMVRREDPWIKARGPLPKDEPSHAIITKELMR